MEYIKNLLILFLFNFALNSCGKVEWDTNLYVQKIEGTSKILYKYNASGGRDTMVNGYILLDSTETFEVDISKNLPFSYLENIPSKKQINGIDIEEPNYENVDKKTINVYIPLKTFNKKENGIDVQTKIFQYEGYSNRSFGLGTFEFENFKETRDSIIFYKLNDIKSLEPQQLDSLKLEKKNIIVRQNKNYDIISIDIEDLKLSKSTNEIIYVKTYFLTPKKKMKSKLISDYGVFKEKI